MDNQQTNRLLNALISALRPAVSTTRSVALTGTLASLPGEDCLYVELKNESNTLIINVGIAGADYGLIDGTSQPMFTSNTSNIKVKGSGTLSYIVHK